MKPKVGIDSKPEPEVYEPKPPPYDAENPPSRPNRNSTVILDDILSPVGTSKVAPLAVIVQPAANHSKGCSRKRCVITFVLLAVVICAIIGITIGVLFSSTKSSSEHDHDGEGSEKDLWTGGVTVYRNGFSYTADIAGDVERMAFAIRDSSLGATLVYSPASSREMDELNQEKLFVVTYVYEAPVDRSRFWKVARMSNTEIDHSRLTSTVGAKLAGFCGTDLKAYLITFLNYENESREQHYHAGGQKSLIIILDETIFPKSGLNKTLQK